MCVQFDIVGVHEGKEDCLYLDVYAPPSKSSELLPVMFWIYGGAFVFGSEYEDGVYNGKRLAEKGVILVAANYRTDVFGFLTLDQLAAEDPQGSTGNLAILDQNFALQWVKNNIRQFGGDPNKVTIFGQSAGGFSVCTHLTSPISKGLFHGAIMESGSCDTPQFYFEKADAVSFSHLFTHTHGCNVSEAKLVECMRKKSVGELVKAWVNVTKFDRDYYRPELYPVAPWGPVIDGVVLKDFPLHVLESGEFNKVPAIMGTVHDEGTVLVPFIPVISGQEIKFPLSNATVFKLLNCQFHIEQPQVMQVLDMYPVKDYKNYSGVADVVVRDYFFVCATRRAIKAFEKANVPIWYYQFIYKGEWWLDTPLGDFHASELVYLFDNYEVIHFSPKDKKMSADLKNYWTNFAKTSNPNGVGVANWTQWDSKSKVHKVLNQPLADGHDLYGAQCDVWDPISPVPQKWAPRCPGYP